MAKRKNKTAINNDIVGILLITFGLLMLISIFSSSASGLVGKYVKKLLIALFGLGSYIFPFFIIIIGFFYIIKKGKLTFNKKFYGILIFVVNTLLFIQMMNINVFYVDNNIYSGIERIYNSNTFIHGGILCYLISIPMYKLFGTIGSYIIFIAIYIISFIMIAQIELSEMLLSIKSTFGLKNKKKSIEVEEKNVEIQNEYAVDGQEKNSYIKNISNKIKIIDFMKSSKAEGADSSPIKTTNDSNNDIGREVTEELEQNIILSSSNTEENREYRYPTVDLLVQNNQSKLNKEDKKELISNANKLEETLVSFGVEAKVVQVTKGPSVTRFELQPSAGVKVSKIVNLADDIALNLAASGVRIEAPIPGKAVVGIEVPNKELTAVHLREVIESPEFSTSTKNLTFCLGKDIGGNCVVSDLTKMPHMLIAGATGSGKSVCINTLIISILYKYSPEDVKLLMIDPKVVELNVYNGIPHLLIPVVTEPKKAAGALNWAVNEMTRRYKLFADNGVRNIEGYNELVSKGKLESKLPLVVIIVDELADLMMVCPNDVEDYIGRLAQMARAAGMHLVIATQRPSVDVITGVIKANIPSRISFAVSSQIDSRTILDTAGAEKLLGKGDMLFYPVGESKPLRIQGAFISEDEVEKVVAFIKNQKNEVEYKTEILEHLNNEVTKPNESDEDELLNDSIRIVVESGQASTSLLQRRLRIGYNRAARIIEQLEEKGIISAKDGSKPRQILVDKEKVLDGSYFQGNNN